MSRRKLGKVDGKIWTAVLRQVPMPIPQSVPQPRLFDVVNPLGDGVFITTLYCAVAFGATWLSLSVPLHQSK